MRFASGPVTRRLALALPFLATALVVALPAARAADTLKIGANIGNLPWEFQDAKGDTVGFEIDLAKEVAKRLGAEATFVNIPFTGLFRRRAVRYRSTPPVSSITITPKRLASVSFAQPYYDSDQSLTVMAKSGITGLKGLAGKTVGVDTGSTGDIYATGASGRGQVRRHPAATRVWRPPCSISRPAASTATSATSRRCSITLRTSRPTRSWNASRPASAIPSCSPRTARSSAKVDAVLTTLKSEGFIAKLHEKWFGVAPDASTTTVMKAEIPKL